MNTIPEIVKPSVEVIMSQDWREVLRHIEKIGRTCYKSEDKITASSYRPFILGLIERGHEAMLEHFSITVKFQTDRGVSHELVRHRLCAFAQTSTRYCNYSQEKFGSRIKVIDPFYFDPEESRKVISLPEPYRFSVDGEREIYMNAFDVWLCSCIWSNWAYMNLVNVFGRSPQEARSVLPNSLATEIYVTANIREWRHILKLRAVGTTGKPHPDMQRLMLVALEKLCAELPVVFDDIMKMAKDKGLYDKGVC